jgi:hypothetical protein
MPVDASMTVVPTTSPDKINTKWGLSEAVNVKSVVARYGEEIHVSCGSDDRMHQRDAGGKAAPHKITFDRIV